MKILPYKISTTNELLTNRAGLLAIAELMNGLDLANRIDATFPQPGSNRGFKPSVFVETLILMQHAGGFHLDDVRDIKMDTALRTLFDWLRRMGKTPQVMKALNTVNKVVLGATLHKRKAVTLDIDATEVIAAKAEARWTYKHHRGYMPIVGHIAETGQVVACEFREGNVSPSKENLELIQQCEKSLPPGCFVKNIRIDAAG